MNEYQVSIIQTENSPKAILTTDQYSTYYHCRAVARSENPGGLVVMGGDNVSTLVEIG